MSIGPGVDGCAARTRISAGRRRRVVSSSQTDAPHRAAPTARCGTTKKADSRDATFSSPRTIWTATKTASTRAMRRGSGASVERWMAIAVQATSAATTTLSARCVAWIACVSVEICGTSAPFISGTSPKARPACWPVTHEPSSIWAKIATAVIATSRVRPGRACAAGIGPWLARSAMKMTAANTVSAIARWAVTSSAARPSSTTAAPSRDCTMTSTPATTAAARSGRSRRRSLKTVMRPMAATSGPTKAAAIRRCECSIQACRSAGGSQSPKQSGQSGQPSPESVARTRPPTAIRTKVATAAATASLANRVNVGTSLEAAAAGPMPSGRRP